MEPRSLVLSRSHLLVTLVALLVLVGCSRCEPQKFKARDPVLPPLRNRFTMTLGDGRRLGGGIIVTIPKPRTGAGAPGLLLSFHADGRAGPGLWDDSGAVHRLAQTGERFNLITVLVQEPHGANWWEGRVVENVRYVEALLDDYLLPRLAIDRRHIFFAGVSGGADFAGGIFPIQTRFKYLGAALVTCGGDLPERMLRPPAVPPRPEAVAAFRYFFANVEDDPDFPPELVAKTAAYLQGVGFRVHSVQADHSSLDGRREYGTGHCSFDTPGWRDRFLEMYFADEQKTMASPKGPDTVEKERS